MELFLIKKYLDQSIKNKKIISIYTYNDSCFYCGYVSSFSEDFVQFKHFSKYGIADGILNLKFDNIRKIELESPYNKNIKYLIENPHLINIETNLDSCDLDSDGIVGLLQKYQNNRSTIVSIETNGEDLSGFVEEVNYSYLVFTEVYPQTYATETSIFKISDITNVRIDDLLSRKTYILYNWNKNKK